MFSVCIIKILFKICLHTGFLYNISIQLWHKGHKKLPAVCREFKMIFRYIKLIMQFLFSPISASCSENLSVLNYESGDYRQDISAGSVCSLWTIRL